MTSESSAIRLDQLLKLSGIVETGGAAKQLVQSGQVKVNGEPETRRGKQLQPDDVIEVEGQRLVVRDVLARVEKSESSE